MQNVSVAWSIGGLFFCVGLGLIIAGFYFLKKAKQTSALQSQHPDQPWFWRKDWADGKVKASTMSQPVLMLIMGLGFSGMGGIATFFSLPEVWQTHNYAALVVLLFPLVGLGLLAAFFVALRSQRRFGKCFFELAQIPIPLGGVLDGMIQTGVPLKLEHELNLKISCVREVTTGSGKSRSTSEYILWQNEKIYSQQADLPALENGTGIPIHFKLPADQPECYSRGNESVFWRLEAKTKLRGPDFHVIFEVPVFKIAGAQIAQGDSAADDSDPTAAFAAPIEEIEENSKIKISDGPNGREFYFPASRNWQMALWATAGILFSIIMMAVVISIATPLFWKFFVGFFVFITSWSCLWLWFGSICVVIDAGGVRVIRRWLCFSSKRAFDVGEIGQFHSGMSRNNLQWAVCLVTQAGKEIEIGNGIATTIEAEWLAKEMAKAFGQTQPSISYSQNKITGEPKAGAAPLKLGIAVKLISIFISLAVAGSTGYWVWQLVNSVRSTAQSAESPKPAEIPKPAQPQPAALTVAFSSFGDGGECATNGLTVESDGHADWFVSATSGRLSVIELKIEPISEQTKRLVVSIAEDKNGVPGAALETFTVARLTHTNTLGWLDLNSQRQPMLKAGTKYWINARSPGAWYWHFNNQNIMQGSMFLPARRKWVAAGYTNVCAFSIFIKTNQPLGRK